MPLHQIEDLESDSAFWNEVYLSADFDTSFGDDYAASRFKLLQPKHVTLYIQ